MASVIGLGQEMPFFYAMAYEVTYRSCSLVPPELWTGGLHSDCSLEEVLPIKKMGRMPSSSLGNVVEILQELLKSKKCLLLTCLALLVTSGFYITVFLFIL